MKNLLVMCGLFSLTLYGQSAEQSIDKGNKFYKQSEYVLAEKQYLHALTLDSSNIIARYNLANTLFRQKRYDEAEAAFTTVFKSKNLYLRSSAYYNTGVMYSRQKDLEGSIDAYKNALRLNPNDKDARENLQKAILELKQKQQQQKKDQQENRDQRPQLNQKEAERKLQELEEKEKQIQQRLQSQKGGNPMPKDW